jgi:hypothetical protein
MMAGPLTEALTEPSSAIKAPVIMFRNLNEKLSSDVNLTN